MQRFPKSTHRRLGSMLFYIMRRFRLGGLSFTTGPSLVDGCKSLRHHPVPRIMLDFGDKHNPLEDAA